MDNPIFHVQTKHIQIQHYYIQEKVCTNVIEIMYNPNRLYQLMFSQHH
jgi:hypothetical protein